MGYSRNNGGGISDGDKGDIKVTASGGTWTIDNLAVTNAKINDVAATKVTEDSTHRFTTDSEKSTWNAKQDTLSNASSSVNGILTSADWNTFNNKQAALGFTPLNPNNNLSDLNNIITSRNNLKFWDIFIINGNQTTTSNQASNITKLVFSASASKRYNINGLIRIGCNNTGGVKLNLTVPTGATFNLLLFGLVSFTPTYTSTLLTSNGTLSNSFIAANDTNGWVMVNGEINMSTTAGNIQFGFASGTNNQTSTVYQLGTQLQITQIN